MNLTNLNPAAVFASWPAVPTPLFDTLSRPDALVYVESGMGYVVYRKEYGPLGDPSSLAAAMHAAPHLFVKDRLAWGLDLVTEAAAAGCDVFLRDAAWRVRNAGILWRDGRSGSFAGWVQEESARARELLQVMKTAGVDNVRGLWGGQDPLEFRAEMQHSPRPVLLDGDDD